MSLLITSLLVSFQLPSGFVVVVDEVCATCPQAQLFVCFTMSATMLSVRNIRKNSKAVTMDCLRRGAFKCNPMAHGKNEAVVMSSSEHHNEMKVIVNIPMKD